ncbi:hypothetical protein ABGB18_03685 [Nonomuraea sp. B12E4]|uniref:hypothetical protein n=1 Tax=Nonomuraea sp. B12E4 TaxID=3153564 RepID=UPI00325E71D4
MRTTGPPAACLARARGRRHGDADAYREALREWSRIDAWFEREHTSGLLAAGPRRRQDTGDDLPGR